LSQWKIGQPHVIARLFQRKRPHAPTHRRPYAAYTTEGLRPESLAQADQYQTVQLRWQNTIDQTTIFIRYLQRRFGLSPDENTAAQLRYDLMKLQAKGWFRKLEGKTLYVLTQKGMTQMTALVKFNQCLNGALGGPPSPIPDVSSPQSQLQKAYRGVRRKRQILYAWRLICA
jgi:hypothetical protein